MRWGARDGPFQGHVEAAACRFQHSAGRARGHKTNATWRWRFDGRRKGVCFVLAQASAAAGGSWRLRALQLAQWPTAVSAAAAVAAAAAAPAPRVPSVTPPQPRDRRWWWAGGCNDAVAGGAGSVRHCQQDSMWPSSQQHWKQYAGLYVQTLHIKPRILIS